jgi:RND family efflux transporter MFP subunit
MKKAVFAVIVLAIAAISFLAGGRYGTGLTGVTGSQGERKVLYYVDPMNPGFRSDEPGVAPCGMPLEPVYADTSDGQVDSAMSLPPGTVKVSPARQQLIGVKVAPVEIRPVTYTLRLYGKVAPDETRIYRLNASTDSWIRELSDITTGSIVDKGWVLAEALAPAYYNAQVTYLIALDNLDRISRQLGGELRHQQSDLADNQIRVAVQALQNLGISDAQIEELANTRRAQPYLQVRTPTRGVVLSRNVTLNQWFKAAEEFYTIADIGRVWVYADVYENEVRHLRPGMKVKVTHSQMGKAFDAKISRVLPLFDPVSKTLKVRIDVDNPLYDLRPDMFVDVEIPVTMPPSLNVPADAVIDSGTKAIVYVDIGNGAFEPRRVETGWRLGRQVEIAGGLMTGEKVVVAGNFLIDSESRMKTAASGTEVKKSKEPVCGMYVDEEKAKLSGRTAIHVGKTYYFCSDWCVQAFKKEPEKYVGDENTEEKGRSRATMPGMENGWLGALKPVRTGRSIEHDATQKRKGTKDTLGKSASPRGIVDWDGPETEGSGAPDRDWGAWGEFPGAKYLGLQDETKKRSEGLQDMPVASGDASPEVERDRPAAAPAPDARGFDMKHEIQEQPASDQMLPSTKQ